MTTENTELKELVEKLSGAWGKFSENNKESQDALTGRIEVLESKQGRPAGGRAQPAKPVEQWIDVSTGNPIPVLAHDQKYVDVGEPNKSGVSFGQWARAMILGGDNALQTEEAKALATTPDASGGFTVPAPLAREFIDRLRSAMVLIQAGARTVPMESKTLQIAKIATDPTVTWHAENASISDSDPTFAAVTLDAKTIVGLTLMSLELAEDSINAQEMVTRALAQGMAVAIDQAGLVGDGTGNSPTGVLNFTNRQQVTSVGTPTNYDFMVNGMNQLLGANVMLDSIGAEIMSPRTWTTLANLKTGISSDQSPLEKPAALRETPFLVTTAVPNNLGAASPPVDSVVLQGNWRELLWGIRTDITVRVLTESFLGSNLQIGVLVYARVDFQAEHEESFVTMEGITP